MDNLISIIDHIKENNREKLINSFIAFGNISDDITEDQFVDILFEIKVILEKYLEQYFYEKFKFLEKDMEVL